MTNNHIAEGFAEGFIDYAERAGVPDSQVDSLLKLSFDLDSAVSRPDEFAAGFAEALARNGLTVPLAR